MGLLRNLMAPHHPRPKLKAISVNNRRLLRMFCDPNFAKDTTLEFGYGPAITINDDASNALIT